MKSLEEKNYELFLEEVKQLDLQELCGVDVEVYVSVGELDADYTADDLYEAICDNNGFDA